MRSKAFDQKRFKEEYGLIGLQNLSAQADMDFKKKNKWHNCIWSPRMRVPSFLFSLVHHQPFAQAVDPSERAEMMSWCEQHCKDQYTAFLCLGCLYFGFYNETDASWFKLTFPFARLVPEENISTLLDKLA